MPSFSSMDEGTSVNYHISMWVWVKMEHFRTQIYLKSLLFSNWLFYYFFGFNLKLIILFLTTIASTPSYSEFFTTSCWSKCRTKSTWVKMMRDRERLQTSSCYQSFYLIAKPSHRTKLRSLWYWIDITQTRNSVLTEVMLSIYSYNMLRKLVMSVY